MNLIERAAQSAVPETGGALKPLERLADATPVLATPALAYATILLTAYGAGNMVTDFVGQESPVDASGEELTGKSGEELLALRQQHIAHG